jgi:hypothetical protein
MAAIAAASGIKANWRKPRSGFRLRKPGPKRKQRETPKAVTYKSGMLFLLMPSKTPDPFHMIFADITDQNMSIHGHQEEPDTESHLSVSIKAIIRDGTFKDQELELQISRKSDFDETHAYAGALFQSKPILMFGISTTAERSGHLVTLIAHKALKEVYLSFEPPKYGKAKVISWHVSTDIEPE